jgi:hypothetical protein
LICVDSWFTFPIFPAFWSPLSMKLHDPFQTRDFWNWPQVRYRWTDDVSSLLQVEAVTVIVGEISMCCWLDSWIPHSWCPTSHCFGCYLEDHPCKHSF